MVQARMDGRHEERGVLVRAPDPNEVDFWLLIAKKRGMPDGWVWKKVEVRGEGDHVIFLLTGAVCTEKFQSGKRAGQLNWDKRDRSTEHELVITRRELEGAKLAWEQQTGKCSRCTGTGKTTKSAREDEGRLVRELQTCVRCGGTGRAPEGAIHVGQR